MRHSGLKYKCVQWAFCSTWRQTMQAVVNQAWRRLVGGIVNCCKQSATFESCCSQWSSVVLTTPESNRRRPASCLSAIFLLALEASMISL